MTTTPLPKVSDAIRTMARGLLESFPHGIPASEMTNLASALMAHADNVGKVEHMLVTRLAADGPPAPLKSRAPSARQPWKLGEVKLSVERGAAAGTDSVVPFVPRPRAAAPTDGGVA